MARGWDSKGVEDQIASAEAENSAQRKVSPQRDREKRHQVESLLLSRTELVNRLKAAQNERYRTQLQLALEHLDARLRNLDPSFEKH